MRKRTLVMLLSCALAVGVLGARGFAEGEPYADTEVSDSSDGKHSLLKITVDGLGEDRFRDLHLEVTLPPPPGSPPGTPPVPAKLPPTSAKEVDVKNGKGEKVGTATLKHDPKTGKVTAIVKDAHGNGLPDGQYYIDIPWNNPRPREAPKGTTTARCTTNGEVTYAAGDVIGGPKTIPWPPLPAFAMTILDPDGQDPVTCSRGAQTPLEVTVAGSLPTDCRYRVFTSVSLNPSYEDLWQVGINSETQPVPPSWGLVFTGLTGELGPNGQPLSPLTVTVPNDPALAGQSFFLVVALLDVDATKAWMVSDPITITIL